MRYHEIVEANRIGSAVTLNNIPEKYKKYPVLNRGTTSIILDKGDGNVLMLTRDDLKVEWLLDSNIAEIVDSFDAPHSKPAIQDKQIYVLEMPKLFPLSSENRKRAKISIDKFWEVRQQAVNKHGWTANKAEKVFHDILDHYWNNEMEDHDLRDFIDFISNYDYKQVGFDIALRNTMQDKNGNIIWLDPVVSMDIMNAFRN